MTHPNPPPTPDPLLQMLLFLQEENKKDRESAERRHQEAMAEAQEKANANLATILAELNLREDKHKTTEVDRQQALLDLQKKYHDEDIERQKEAQETLKKEQLELMQKQNKERELAEAAAAEERKQHQKLQERRQLLKAIPLPPPDTNFEEFFRTLNSTLTQKETPEDLKAPTLISLLNDKLK